jgi:hypothetical protein
MNRALVTSLTLLTAAAVATFGVACSDADPMCFAEGAIGQGLSVPSGLLAVTEEDRDGDGRVDYRFYDYDDDGNPDAVVIDLDEDGVDDAIWFDTDDDGSWDRVDMDNDDDGVMDTGWRDWDRDGAFETFWEDEDGDGAQDCGEEEGVDFPQPFEGPRPGVIPTAPAGYDVEIGAPGESDCVQGTPIVQAARWECPAGEWLFVEVDTYQCPDGTLEDDVRTTNTREECSATDQVYGHTMGESAIPDDTCPDAVTLGATALTGCADGVHTLVTSGTYGCSDGSITEHTTVEYTDGPCG